MKVVLDLGNYISNLVLVRPYLQYCVYSWTPCIKDLVMLGSRSG